MIARADGGHARNDYPFLNRPARLVFHDNNRSGRKKPDVLNHNYSRKGKLALPERGGLLSIFSFPVQYRKSITGTLFI